MARTSVAPPMTGDKEFEGSQSVTMPMRPKLNISFFKIFIYLLLTAGAIIFVMPFLWMASTSLMTTSEVARGAFVPKGELLGLHKISDEDLVRPLGDFLFPTAEVDFNGVSATIHYRTLNDGAAFDVYVDNQLYGTVDTHADIANETKSFVVDSYPEIPTLSGSQRVALADERHTLRLVYNETASRGDNFVIDHVVATDGNGQETTILNTSNSFEILKGHWEQVALADGKLVTATFDEETSTWLADGVAVDEVQILQRSTNLDFPEYFRSCCYNLVDRSPRIQRENPEQFIRQERPSGGHAVYRVPFNLTDQKYIVTGSASHYVRVWDIGNFGEYFVNSVIITLMTVSTQTLFAILAAYAFAKMNFPGRNVLFSMFLLTIFIPAMVTLIPNVLTVTDLSRWTQDAAISFNDFVGQKVIDPDSVKWLDNWPALVVPFLASTFSIFLLRQFFIQIPDELWDAAQIDGAGHLRFLFRVVVPISRAAITTVVLFSFIGVWDQLEWPLLVTSSENWRPIAVGIYNFRGDEGQRPNLLMAASMIALLPVIISYFVAQKQFTEGIATTGLKG